LDEGIPAHRHDEENHEEKKGMAKPLFLVEPTAFRLILRHHSSFFQLCGPMQEFI
jgi:hypothetical protein